MTTTEQRINESRKRMQALKAALAANPEATEAEKCDMFRAHGFHTQHSLAAILPKR